MSYCPYYIIKKFYRIKLQEQQKNKNDQRKHFLEKEKIKFFNIDNILSNSHIHRISKLSIKFYWNNLIIINYKVSKVNEINKLSKLSI